MTKYRVNSQWVVFALCTLLGSKYAAASEVMYYWPQVPIEIDLSVGAEQRITIPEAESLRIGIPQPVKRKLNVEIIGNHIWLTAKEPIANARLVLIADPIGRVVIELRAQENEQFSQPIVIQSKAESNQGTTGGARYGFVTLTRWAVQQLYAPKRLLNELPGLQRLAVDSTPWRIFRCANRIPTVCAGAVIAIPIASWQSLNHYITAIRITNTLARQVTLDPRELSGNWRSAAFVHSRLHANGHPGDSTALVVISDYPFEISRQ